MQHPLPKAKIMFPYTASQEDEITVKEGDIVEIVEKVTDQDGWMKIRLGSKEGLMPDNFLEPLPGEYYTTSALCTIINNYIT